MSRAVAFDDGQVNLTSNFPNRQPVRAKTLQRGKTLSRPERFVEPTPLLTPVIRDSSNTKKTFSTWVLTSKIITFWAPGFLLRALGQKDAQVQQAWREKITLCFIALLLGCFVGFLTVGLSAVLCPSTLGGSTPADFLHYKQISGLIGILGWSFNITGSLISSGGPNFFALADQAAGMDVTNYFMRTNADSPACNGLKSAVATTQPCFSNNGYDGCPLPQLNMTTFSNLKITNTSKHVGYDWVDLANLKNFFVIDGNVLNLDPYMAAHPQPVSGDSVDNAIRTVLFTTNLKGGKDATRLFFHREELKMAIPCLEQKYYAGHIDKDTPGCFVAQMFLYFSLIVILGIVMTRFFMAMIFNWFISAKLAKNPKGLPRRGGSLPKAMKVNEVGAELYTVCLVTAYSEEENGIRTTVESLASTDYPDDRKMILVIADGIITGSGQTRTTPDICIGLLDQDPRFGTPQAMSYVAVAAGSKQHNMAKVYAGHYTRVKGHRTPMIVIVKTGTPEEAKKGGKPGNRGKRDSQLIVMNFFQHVTFNDRMTPLDYDLFRKCHMLMGVTPDFFEVVLMVDADTIVYKDSLVCLINCLQNDQLIMGVCGETRIANKRQSWVTMIQVFEYYISHHLGKGFESVFGGVTCLPGCFCCYRLKTRRNGEEDWVPILAKPEIVREYSQNTVETLHQKNLLLLGEDRFLSTLMLRNFPTRKMMFCPQAVCRTVVPDEFRVLLSQRRRWINSTIHNLMELVLVRNLCGTFCFSMQFVVFMELIGTTVLPVALILTYSLIAHIIMNPPKHITEAVPVALLFIVLIFPGILILVTTRKVVYVAWMLIYLLALPVWNLVLPLYAYWHFDDFSWGETRKVEGETGDDHGKKDGQFDASSVPLRRWEEWEKSRIKKVRREGRRRRELAKSFGIAKFYEQNDNGGDYFQNTTRSPSPQVYYNRASSSPQYPQINSSPQTPIPQMNSPSSDFRQNHLSSRPKRQSSMISSYYGVNDNDMMIRQEREKEWQNIRGNTNNNNISHGALLLGNDSIINNRISTVADDEMQRMLDDGWGGEDRIELDQISSSSQSPLTKGHPLAHSSSPLNHATEISNSVSQVPMRNGQSTAVGVGYHNNAHRRNQSGGKSSSSYR